MVCIIKLDCSNKRRLKWIIDNGYLSIFNDSTNYLPLDCTHKERVYCYVKGISELQKCHCGNLLKFTDKGYTKFCSRKCGQSLNKVSIDKSVLYEDYIINKMSLLDVSNKHKTSIPTIKKLLTGFDIEMRSHSAAQKLKYQSIKKTKFPHIDFDKINDFDWILTENETRSIADIANEIGVSATVIFRRFKERGLNSKCPISFNSKEELDIHKMLGNVEYINNSRDIIPPLELDIYIPAHKLAIEVNGIYWHSELSGKDRMYHLIKTTKCRSLGIDLLHFWDIEIHEKPKIIKSMILSRCSKSSRIFARKCRIKSVDNTNCSIFLNDNHLQGNCVSSINYGLYYENELISLMTFGKSRFSKNTDYELIRFCNKVGYSVIGGASKILSHFKKLHKGSIVSYANKRWSNGNLYKQLGFEYSHDSSPNYFYTKDYKKLESRNKYQKHKLVDMLVRFDDSMSEWDNMKINLFDRIWDCGNQVWVMKT